MQQFLGAVLQLLLFSSTVQGQLNAKQKQILLDLNNIYRASNTKISVTLLEWNTQLEQEALDYVADCDAADPKSGVVQFFNTSSQSEDDETRLTSIFEGWLSKQADENQILFRQSRYFGCAEAFCPRLTTTITQKIGSSSLLACIYNPAYFEVRPNTRAICSRGKTINCPAHAKNCISVENITVSFRPGRLAKICSPLNTYPVVPPDPIPTSLPTTMRRVTRIIPRFGSVAGGQTITLFGSGFSGSDLDGQNEVYFTRGSERIPCVVTDYSSSTSKIVCVTGPSPIMYNEGTYNIEVYVTLTGTSRERVTDICSSCTYVYHYYARTPIIQDFRPNALSFGETITIYGWLYANSFADTADSGSDEATFDHFTRLLVGGMPCNHNPPDNNTQYIAELDSNRRNGQIECRPTTGYNYGPVNVTLFTEDRGASTLDLRRYLLLSYDNKFQPYTVVIHPDILDVYPRVGSRGGSTRIYITVNMPLTGTNLTSIVVNVGGVPCTDLSLTGSYDNHSVIECTTGPQPPSTAYYPGGRGWQREVWTTGFSGLNRIVSLPKSDKVANHERAFLHSDFVSDFGELYNIHHRFTGFFVPPATSLYTFGVRSDDGSAFYLSSDANSNNLPSQPTATAPAYSRESWTWYPEQTSAPVFLKEGEYYYFMMVANQGGDAWNVALGAKVHNLSYTAPPYIGDKEEQLVSVTSTVMKEKHTIHIEAQPLVQTLTIIDPSTPSVNCTAFCPILLSLDSTDFNISRDMSSQALKELLNGISAVQAIGRIEVFRDESSSDYFMSNNSRDVHFTIVFLTTAGITMNDIPVLSVSSTVLMCEHINTDTNTTCGDYQVTASAEITQQLRLPPSSYTVGFDMPAVSAPRWTKPLALNASEDQVSEEISNLFAWNCQSDVDSLREQGRVLYHSSLEDSSENNRVNETSFCGHYSEQDPRNVWRNDEEPYDPNQFRYACFAYRGSLPNFRVIHSYTNVITEVQPGNSVPVQFADFRRNINTRISVSQCEDYYPFLNSQPTGEDGWSDYSCVNIRDCLMTLYPSSMDHLISRVFFNNAPNFYVDEFVIASSEVSFTRSEAPAKPNGISVNYIEVSKAFFDQPQLRVTETSINGSVGSVVSLQRDYSMILYTVCVTYTVRDCGDGMQSLTGYYGDQSNMTAMYIEQTAQGSPPVSGTFDLKFMDETIEGIPADIKEDTFEMLLEAVLKDEGGFDVERSGSCSGYNWKMSWSTKGGDLPPLEPISSGLRGDGPPEVVVTTLVDGGTWLRPIGGEMLRLPHKEPQVEVIIDGTPSSCHSKGCSFSFEDGATPTIEFIYPLEGQGGTLLSIYGTGFSTNTTNTTVSVGKGTCTIVSANMSHITCTLADHPAGYYDIVIQIGGMGVSVSTNTSCFHYLLTVDSVSPVTGGVGGGSPITITGQGFMEFTPVFPNELEAPFSFLPWFRYGLGVPSQDCIRNLRLCPMVKEKLLTNYNVSDILENVEEISWQKRMNRSEKVSGTPQLQPFNCTKDYCEIDDIFAEGQLNYYSLILHLHILYSLFPSSVLIDNVPCIITESTVSQLTCVPLPLTPTTTNITVTVFSETITLTSTYEATLLATPLISNITPYVGAVTGNTEVKITGTNFNISQSQVNVTIGGSKCYVQSANDTVITCITSPSKPSYAAVLVYTPNGVAILESSFMELTTGSGSSGSGGSVLETDKLVMFPIFHYKLVLNAGNGVASVGSVFGGAEVIVNGGIFMPGQTMMLVGGHEVGLQEVTMDTIRSIAPPSIMTYNVKLQRSSFTASGSSVTFGFFWEPNSLEIQVGDTIIMELSESVQELSGFIHVDIDLDLSSDTLSSRLSSKDGQSTSFMYTFRKLGNYMLSGLTNQQFMLSNFMINVTGPRPSSNRVEVIVGGNVATIDRTMLQGISKRQTQNCDLPEPDLSELTVQYSPCLTPSITSIEPQIGYRLQTTFTINGTLFNTVPNQNIVKFGDYNCTTITSSETSITCVMEESSGMPPTLTDLPVSVNAVGLGNAYIEDESESSIVLRPFISDITPSFGSLKGGTDVFIHGDGFPTAADSITVTMGDQSCTVTSTTYGVIRCSAAADLDTDLQVNITVLVSLNSSNSQPALCMVGDGCTFTFSDAHTPKVFSVSPLSIHSIEDSTIIITGSGFSNHPSSTSVMFGNEHTYIMGSTENTITVILPPQPANSYALTVRVCNASGVCSGFASIQSADNTTLISVPRIISVSPASGSVQGGTEVTITGCGFNSDPNIVEVSIGNDCDVQNVSYSEIVCITSATDPGPYSVQVSIPGLSNFPETEFYNYSMDSTPVINSLSPSSGAAGTVVTLSGNDLVTAGAAIVMFGEADCIVTSTTNTSIICTADNNFAGTYRPDVTITGIGAAFIDSSVNFTYMLRADSVTPSEGSYAGLSTVEIRGSSFNPAEIDVTVCNMPCPLAPTTHSVSRIECILSAMNSTSISNTSIIECDVVVTLRIPGDSATISNGYTYRADLTPYVHSVNRTRGGTGGGSVLMITGQGFSSNATVTIAGSNCEIQSQSETEIVCTTGASGRNIRTIIMVFIKGFGFAVSEIEFWYVDLWSSPFTWEGGIIPSAGDFVVVPKGQTLVLDVVTPILGYILIQGGALIFDPEKGDNEVALHTQGGLITSDGVFQVGTEDQPFMSKTEIVLYGHVLSTELPVYGAKTLALRRGTLDIHGRPMNLTWTRLSQTVAAGSDTIYLQEYVEWEVGGTIVIASTSFSQRENEEKIIATISAGSVGSVITLSEPLDYEHISIQQTIAGRYIDTSAEVGYLTRNVVIRGNLHEEWVEEVPNCPEEFQPGQFDIQTCFQGRFGAETINDQFGSQVMIHAAEQNQGHVTARFGYIEVTHAGQAFRLGRYPIHFHLNGNVSGSYVRGCGIHHTFNRAVTIHAVNYLLVEKNVAFNIMGHAYFLEDGIEEHNIIQDNLGVFVRASSSLLNVDITPATFWVVNPNNIVRRNAAAGGTHFGFWYRLPRNPEGPSFTSSVCPRHLPLEEFSDNSAHSFSWYGLWVFREYHPSITGNCWDTRPSPVYYDRFLAWRNDKGIEFEQTGALQIRDSIMLDNTLAGIEITDVRANWSGEDDDGPLVKDTLIVGYSNVSIDTGTITCSESGIKTPHSYYLSVSNVTFVNFDRPNCYPVQPCSFCRHPFEGGFETRFKQISYINAGDDITMWNYFHEHVQRDLDGTLTRSGSPSVLIPSSNLYHTGCREHSGSSTGPSPGLICSGDIKFGRIGIHDPLPDSLTSSQLNLTSDYGTDQLPFAFRRLRGGPGQMAIVPLNETYELTWVEGTTFSNITYSVVTAGFESDDYVLFRQRYPRPLDFTSVRGVTTAVNVSNLESPATANTGDWAQIDNTTLLYIVKGTEEFDADKGITFSTYRCFYENCIPPAPPTRPPLPTIPPPQSEGRPDDFVTWSNISIWPGARLPQEGEDVHIERGMYVVVDMALPRLGRLIISGRLELNDSIDHMIDADFVIVDGGRLAIGYPDTPFQHQATIMLHGNVSSEELGNRLKRNFFTNIGAKALAVFGDLFLHGVTRMPTWTTLAATATAGSTILQLTDPVTWVVGDRIIVTSTSYDAYETEEFEIADVTSPTVIYLTSELQHTHSGGYFISLGAGNMYTTRAEVGLLTRNIVITNDDNNQAESEAFGCRVVVSQNEDFTARAQIDGVEFRQCGQLGYTQTYDPRFSLAILNIDDSYVRDCSINEGYNTGIGVFDSNRATISGNVIYRTVGESVIARGSEHNITDNLGAISRYIGTFRRDDPLNTEWTANFEVTEVSSLRLVGNAAAGGAKVGFHTNGEECSDSSSTYIRDNTAHSVLHGIHLGYSDGLRSGCSRFSHFNIFSCYFFGLFSYSQSGVHIFDSTFTNNKAAIYTSTIGPGSRSHIRGTKTNKFERVLIISAGEDFTCDDDNKRPEIADHQTSHSGILSPSGGHLAMIMPTFFSGGGHFPEFAWWSITSYPAIAGLTEINQVTFANFHIRCEDKRDIILFTHPSSEDVNHPIHLKQIVYVSDTRFSNSIENDNKLFVRMPNLGSVNPSDCVDMDCDGFKQIVLRDLDGTFTEAGADRSIVSFAEFAWNGDPRRGLGDFRIPRTMLTRPDGSRIPIEDIYPRQGIPRSLTSIDDTETCAFNNRWNMYVCQDIEHVMMVLESLDADTEVRRLSPIGIGANGYINLVNGPQDQGWCGGYTCQERISTFFVIVATGLHYTVALTSTNPQNFAVYMLNARQDQSIVTCVIYTNPQRLDVYHNDMYVVPKNAERMDDGNLRYLESATPNEFVPLVSDPAGSNYYNRDTKQLCITIKGDATYEIRTTPVIVLSINVQVTVDTFFDENNIVRNIALLLGIPDNRIRIVSVSRETSRRKKRQSDGSQVENTEIEFEIGDPPQEMLEEEIPTQAVNMTDSGMNTTDSGMGQNVTTNNNLFTFEDLIQISEQVVTIVQTGEIVMALNVSANLTRATINEPEPPPVDKTGGVRATPDTGGPQPEDFVNSTESEPLTFSEIQRIEEEAELNRTVESVFSIPTALQIYFEPGSGATITEGVSLGEYAPVVRMLNNNGEVVVNLGLDIPWVLTVEISSGSGFLVQETANFTMGQATFTNLIFSHPGEYRLSYRVTYPTTAQFGVSSSQTIRVQERQLGLRVTQQPGIGNTTFILYPYPTVSLVDLTTQTLIEETRWRNSTWTVVGTLRNVLNPDTVVQIYQQTINGREVVFDNITIESAGDYVILFEAYSVPASNNQPEAAEVSFSIVQREITKLDITYNVDFNSTIGGQEEVFIAAFTYRFTSLYPYIEIIEITLREGSIIVGVIITAVDPQQLVSVILQTTNNPADLSFDFNNTHLTSSNVTQDPDPAYIVTLPTLPPNSIGEHYIVNVILGTVIPGVFVITSVLIILAVGFYVYSHKKKMKRTDLYNKVAPTKNVTTKRPPSAKSSLSEDLLPYKTEKLDAKSFVEGEPSGLSDTPAYRKLTDVSESESIDDRTISVRTPEVFFTNPGVIEAEGVAMELHKVHNNLDEVIHLPDSSDTHSNLSATVSTNSGSRPPITASVVCSGHSSQCSEQRPLLLSTSSSNDGLAARVSSTESARVHSSLHMEVEDIEL